MRRLRFRLLEAVILPLAILPLRALVRTWRRGGPDPALLAEIAATPRVIVTIWHATLLEALAFATMWKPFGRDWVVLTTPSLDGRLAARMIELFGTGQAPLAPAGRGVDAAAEFIRRVERGDVGAILVDGPRGPRGIVKPGVARTIAAARARVVVAGLGASRAFHFNSWDRTCLPAPFASVETCWRLLPPATSGDEEYAALIQSELDAVAEEARRAAASTAARDDTGRDAAARTSGAADGPAADRGAHGA